MSGWQLEVSVSDVTSETWWMGRFGRTVGQQPRNCALLHPDKQEARQAAVSRVAQIERRQKVEVCIPETVLKDDVGIWKLLDQLKGLVGQPSVR